MDKNEFPSESTILQFFLDGGKGTKREIAETLNIPPNEGPKKRWRDKLDSILRRLHKQGWLDRKLVKRENSQRLMFQYSQHPDVTVCELETKDNHPQPQPLMEKSALDLERNSF